MDTHRVTVYSSDDTHELDGFSSSLKMDRLIFTELSNIDTMILRTVSPKNNFIDMSDM